MNKIVLALLTLGLVSGCGTTSHRSTEIHGYEGPRVVSQETIITKTRSCVESGMKAVVVYMPQNYPSGTIDVPVGVNCYATWNMK
jgi:uncharacterized protein YceK